MQKTPAIPVDPNLEAEKKRAQDDMVGALTTQTQADQASLMARYGTQLAIAGAATVPAAPSSSPFDINVPGMASTTGRGRF